jgi:hypothetical protein
MLVFMFDAMKCPWDVSVFMLTRLKVVLDKNYVAIPGGDKGLFSSPKSITGQQKTQLTN